jgi:hypothetical protein
MPQIPAPKYGVGETVLFNRDKAEGDQLGMIHTVDLRLSSTLEDAVPGTNHDRAWEIEYYTQHDDPVPEACIKGVCVMGPPR